MTTYRISQLANRAGVPATTLRYYEEAGLLPAERSQSGYRVYDDLSVARLEFISSAKLLGLPLEEIRDLLGVWEQGVCAQVRATMLPLVDVRIADADRRMAEMSAFSDRLVSVREELSGPAPEGGCDQDCGCVTQAEAGPVPVQLEVTRPAPPAYGEAWPEAPVACTLNGSELGERTDQWHRVVDRATGREEVADGLRLTFPPGAELASELAVLAVAEQDCCGFFDFTLQLNRTELVLTVRAPEAAAPMLADLFGASV